MARLQLPELAEGSAVRRGGFPDDKFWPYIGLARAYTALGDKKNAITSWETALQHLPPSQSAARPRLEAALKALKEGA